MNSASIFAILGRGSGVFISAVIAADGYTIDLTYDNTPPLDDNFILNGTPEFVVGATVVGNVRTLRVSGAILTTETVTINSDTLTAQATINNSTEDGDDFRTDLLLELDPRIGLANTGDGTQVTSWADQSGNGFDTEPIDPGLGGTYVASYAPFNNQPALFHGTIIGTQQSTAAGLLAALAGTGKPFTVIAILSMNGNINSQNALLSYGLKNNATNQYVYTALVSATSQVRANMPGLSVTRACNNADEWQQVPQYPIIMAITYENNATVSIKTSKIQSLSLNDNSFIMTFPLSVNTVALNARLQAIAYVLGGAYRLGKYRLYNRALTDSELRQVGRYMVEGYKTWGIGCSPARALAS